MEANVRLCRLLHAARFDIRRTSSTANVGEGKDSEARQRRAIESKRPTASLVHAIGTRSVRDRPALRALDVATRHTRTSFQLGNRAAVGYGPVDARGPDYLKPK
jgi:hypothetical protein